MLTVWHRLLYEGVIFLGEGDEVSLYAFVVVIPRPSLPQPTQAVVQNAKCYFTLLAFLLIHVDGVMHMEGPAQRTERRVSK